ncbi:DUF2218 domain-containing protein [Luteimonas huabeiensis]|uniref:DUF2218 domain-containing protein n=1 Tax=Luteimonas huabeiensis TaxID=1244513 RepID=UPI000467923C|nr:DUF2218 domain-containing protein [Luteimonas huabeiensis]
MTASHALVASNDAPRLLRTLVNHWRHKFEIRRDDETHAYVPFAEDGGADFRVEGERLRIEVRHADPAQRERLQQVIENHLQRFARNETLAFDWTAHGA